MATTGASEKKKPSKIPGVVVNPIQPMMLLSSKREKINEVVFVNGPNPSLISPALSVNSLSMLMETRFL